MVQQSTIALKAAQTIDRLYRDERELLSYFCEFLVLNEAISRLGGKSPVESTSPLANGMRNAIVRFNPDMSERQKMNLYIEVVSHLRSEGFPKRFMKVIF